MALEDETTTQLRFSFDIPQGAHFHLEFPPMADPETSLPFDFANDPEGNWTARMEIRTADGDLAAAFATSGEDGVITLDTEGVIALDMTEEFTAALTATYDPKSYSGQRSLFADLELVDPADGTTWRWFTGKGRITKEITSS